MHTAFRRIAAVASLGLLACGPQPLVPVGPDRAMSAGDTARFGAGLVALSSDGRNAELALAASARTALFVVRATGDLSLLQVRTMPPGRRRVGVMPSAAGRTDAVSPGAGFRSVPCDPTTGTGRTATDSGASRAECQRRSAEGPRGATPRANPPLLDPGDALLLVVWDGEVNADPRLILRERLRVARPADAGQLVPELLRLRPGTWASYLVAIDRR